MIDRSIDRSHRRLVGWLAGWRLALATHLLCGLPSYSGLSILRTLVGAGFVPYASACHGPSGGIIECIPCLALAGSARLL